MKLSSRVVNLKAEAAFIVLEKAKMVEKKGVDVVHLEIGEPDFDTPQHIKEAGIEALRRGETHYTPTPGIPELREAIVEHLKEIYGIDYDWRNNIAVTIGAKQAIVAAMLAILNEGDEVIYPNPGYPAYSSAAEYAGAKTVPYKLVLEDNFSIKPDKLAEMITPKTKIVVLNSPNNPCGSTMSSEEVRGVVELAEDHGFYILSDEIYRPILFDGLKHQSPLNYASDIDKVILVDGFSKRYAMTGWRIGYLAVSKEIYPYIVKLLNIMTSCPASFVQHAAISALRGPQEPVYQMVREYEKRRNAVVEELSKIDGIRFTKPSGAFYAFIDVSRVFEKDGRTSEQFVLDLIERYGVAFLHGTAMGSYGEGYIRMCFANSIENIRKGIRRLGKAISDALA
ncbi:MAG: pyridoxal phosphate-dependent aminotransferase [Aigarchaeota archaeon]|nr:pyridoxal phosphate-dependent aminotransferase [Aigarchaeota archaeon]MDW7986687.1 pyridoxal phosphate-dependent aminotransferase [Nitrososphaerota archaeon]